MGNFENALLIDGQILRWPVSHLTGIVIDDSQGKIHGSLDHQ